jgi:hypothetical protein
MYPRGAIRLLAEYDLLAVHSSANSMIGINTIGCSGRSRLNPDCLRNHCQARHAPPPTLLEGATPATSARPHVDHVQGQLQRPWIASYLLAFKASSHLILSVSSQILHICLTVPSHPLYYPSNVREIMCYIHFINREIFITRCKNGGANV